MQRPHARSRLKIKSDMDPLRLHTQPGQRPSLAKSKCKPKKSIILITVGSAAIALIIFFVCYTFLLSGRNRRVSLRYSVVIDGGSSGTRVHVFGYRIDSGNPVFDFIGDDGYASLKLSPGLSSYAGDPEGASVSVAELVEFAKGRVPKGKLKECEIRLMATAGMRLLDVSVQERILEVARRVLRSSGFKFRDELASVISGSDEGIYAWVVANHALGSLGGDPLQTTGIVELGGASTQFLRTITYGNVSYRIYSHSFLNLGQDAAHEKLWESLNSLAANSTEKGIVTDPCTPKGYILDKNSTVEGIVLPEESKFTDSLQAAGNFSKCRSAAFNILQEGKEKCHYKHCSIGSTFTPNLRGSFLATENFFHTSKFFGLREKDWLSAMISAGESFCGDDWSKLKVKHPTFKDESLLRYCFSSAYIVSMLHDSLGVALDDQRVEFASEAGEKGIPLDWALGAFILNTATAISDNSEKFFLSNVRKQKIMKPEIKEIKDTLRVQMLPVHHKSSTTYVFTTKSESKPTKPILLLVLGLFLSVAITLAFLFVLYMIVFSGWNLRSSFRYSVVIDAGSSGSRAHVFRYWFESGKPVFDFGEENYASLKLSPGLSSYADNPQGASVSVKELVEFAKGRVPKDVLKKSEIRLMATAGMRLLDVSVQEQILEVTRCVLRSSGFKFQDEWASVISGFDEGMYAWVVANYALGSLGGDPLHTTGIVELGGASAQVTFVSSETAPPGFSRTISYGGVSYKIYSHSFLHYGQVASESREYYNLLIRVSIRKRITASKDGIVTDPCTPKGYIYDNNSVQAAENFYHTSKFFGLDEKDWLSEMISAGKSFCGEEWSKLKEKYPTTKEKYLDGYCFSSAYIISLLHDSLGFALDDERIEFANKAGEKGIALDWALGAFILNTDTTISAYNGRSRKMLG
ncbi:hypothetical protein HID58_021491 [Brassica napus]|uniref:apyrase n=1 Tax=Brassica napus TaxID=3708 RepID=A0ABQ8CY45_BRANA|nr:hypothetical protein HID58_021491 [Brassica napus]